MVRPSISDKLFALTRWVWTGTEWKASCMVISSFHGSSIAVIAMKSSWVNSHAKIELESNLI
jgi:hypothetical protein